MSYLGGAPDGLDGPRIGRTSDLGPARSDREGNGGTGGKGGVRPASYPSRRSGADWWLRRRR